MQCILASDDLEELAHDFSKKTVREVLRRLVDKDKLMMSKEQHVFLQRLIRNAQQFEKEQQGIALPFHALIVHFSVTDF